MASLEILQRMRTEIQKKVTEEQNLQQELKTAVKGVQGLESQLFENNLVKQELDQLEEEVKVYKLVGPVLIPQEPDEAKTTVQTRITFIAKELRGAAERVEKIESEQKKKREALLTEQQKFQSLAQQSAAIAQQ